MNWISSYGEVWMSERTKRAKAFKVGFGFDEARKKPFGAFVVDRLEPYFLLLNSFHFEVVRVKLD